MAMAEVAINVAADRAISVRVNFMVFSSMCNRLVNKGGNAPARRTEQVSR